MEATSLARLQESHSGTGRRDGQRGRGRDRKAGQEGQHDDYVAARVEGRQAPALGPR
jgi:hypothetical protein